MGLMSRLAMVGRKRRLRKRCSSSLISSAVELEGQGCWSQLGTVDRETDPTEQFFFLRPCIGIRYGW